MSISLKYYFYKFFSLFSYYTYECCRAKRITKKKY